MRFFRNLVRTLQNACARNGKGFGKFSDRAVFVKVDIDENLPLAARYGIMSIPLVAVFKGGEQTAKTLGYMSASEAEKFLEENL